MLSQFDWPMTSRDRCINGCKSSRHWAIVPTTCERVVSSPATGATLATGPSLSCLFWPRPGFYGREVLKRRLSAVAPSRTTGAYCPESIISSFCRRWFAEFSVGPGALNRFHWNILDLLHVPVTVDAARVPENLWNDCTGFYRIRHWGGSRTGQRKASHILAAASPECTRWSRGQESWAMWIKFFLSR